MVLNHLSVKYPDPGEEIDGEEENRKSWRGMLREIERQAEESWGVERAEGEEWRVRTASDFMEVEIRRRDKLGKKDRKKGSN